MTGNNPKLDLVNVDVHTDFGQILSIRSQDIERKRNSDCNSKVSSKEEQYKVFCLLEALFFPNVSAFYSLLQRKLLTFCKLYILCCCCISIYAIILLAMNSMCFKIVWSSLCLFFKLSVKLR